MIEPLFGSGSLMWSAVPSTGFPYQAPIGYGNHPAPTPVFNSPMAAISSGAQGITAPNAPPANAYPYGGGMMAANAYVPGPSAALVSSEAIGVVTAPALLAAVAIRRGQPQGPTNDQEIEDFVYDAFELLPGAADVEVRCDAGRLTLTGNVQHKRLKRDVGEIAWAIPSLVDVQNNVTITSRRRTRSREETASSVPGRKQA